MKHRATRTLLATSAALAAAAVALASPALPATEAVISLDAPSARLSTAAATMSDPICLRCHWCPFGDGRGPNPNGAEIELPSTGEFAFESL